MKSSDPRRAAALILRDQQGRILVTERSRQLPFLGGYLAFVGGRVDEGDAALAQDLFGGNAPAEIATVVRELLEETGLLLTEEGPRRHDRTVPLRSAYQASGATPPSTDRFQAAGRWITPDYVPIRFDTLFFLVDGPVPDAPEPDGQELVAAWMQTAAHILEDFKELRCFLSRPTSDQLRALANGATAEAMRKLDGTTDASGLLQGTEARPFEPVAGIWQFPLRSPTLPPATHTNCLLVGHERAVVIDPATYDDVERARLGEFLDARVTAGTKLSAVVLTHHHRDHVGSARWVAERYGIPVQAHPVTRALLENEVRVDELLNEGDIIDLGRDAAGHPFELECLHTPGHAAGHLVFVDRRGESQRMIVGDMVAGIGTIIVDPDEGSMNLYIEALRRLRALPESVLFPAHGGPIVAGHAKLDHYITHRLAREAKVREALEAFDGPATAADLLPSAYADTPKEIWFLAERSCLAHLKKLAEDGVAAFTDDRFVLT